MSRTYADPTAMEKHVPFVGQIVRFHSRGCPPAHDVNELYLVKATFYILRGNVRVSKDWWVTLTPLNPVVDLPRARRDVDTWIESVYVVKGI